MSTGLECQFFEWNPGEWYYALQNWNCPVGAWDWREEASAYGPFANSDIAERHLSQNHANPGGYSTCSYDPKRKESPVFQRLVKEARK